jgi:ketosteroid isomerase-like protein
MQSLDDFAKSDLDKLERLAENFEWIHKQHDHLKEKYDNQYVAIKDKRIVDKDTNLDRLVNRMNITNYDESIAIEYIYN